MLLDFLHENKQYIEELAKSYGAKSIKVFGSASRKAETTDSDIDFLVEFDSGYDMFAQRIPLTHKLEEFTNRRVDLIPKHELSKRMRHYVLKEAIDL